MSTNEQPLFAIPVLHVQPKLAATHIHTPVYSQTELLNSVLSNECIHCHQIKDIKSFADNSTCFSCQDLSNKNILIAMQKIESALRLQSCQPIPAETYLREAALLSMENNKLREQLEQQRKESSHIYSLLLTKYNNLTKYVDRAEWHIQLRENYHSITDKYLSLT